MPFSAEMMISWISELPDLSQIGLDLTMSAPLRVLESLSSSALRSAVLLAKSNGPMSASSSKPRMLFEIHERRGAWVLLPTRAVSEIGGAHLGPNFYYIKTSEF